MASIFDTLEGKIVEFAQSISGSHPHVLENIQQNMSRGEAWRAGMDQQPATSYTRITKTPIYPFNEPDYPAKGEAMTENFTKHPFIMLNTKDMQKDYALGMTLRHEQSHILLAPFREKLAKDNPATPEELSNVRDYLGQYAAYRQPNSNNLDDPKVQYDEGMAHAATGNIVDHTGASAIDFQNRVLSQIGEKYQRPDVVKNYQRLSDPDKWRLKYNMSEDELDRSDERDAQATKATSNKVLQRLFQSTGKK